MRVYNSIVYQEAPKNRDEYEEYLKYLPKDLADKIRGIKHGS